MIKKNKILAIIPARGGSKGLANKNILEVAGKPLIAWTIEEAKRSKYLDRIILSSEDPGIIEIARRYGCEVPFVRPAGLAEDDTPGVDPIIHALNTLNEKYDYVVVLQPTSPLRTFNHIDCCLEMLDEKKAPACVSVSRSSQNPYWMFILDKGKTMRPLLAEGPLPKRRQELPAVYSLNGAIYCARVDWLLRNKCFVSAETRAFVMPPESSVDIDTESDLKMCELILREKIK